MNRLTVFIILLLISSVTGAEGITPYTAVKNAEGVQEVVMNAKSYSFSPDRVIVQVGVAIELKIKKSGWTPHTFIIPASGLDIKEKARASKYTVIKSYDISLWIGFFDPDRQCARSTREIKNVLARLDVGLPDERLLKSALSRCDTHHCVVVGRKPAETQCWNIL